MSRRRPAAAAAAPAARTLVAPLLDPLEARRVFAAPWGSAPQLIGLDDLAADHPNLTGAGQAIAILDTGIDYTHASLGGGLGAGHKVVAGYDFVDDDADPMDTDGHGTAVAGVAAADPFEAGGFTYRGVAPGAKLVALRIAATTADVPLDRIEAGLQWVIENAATYGITVVNLSFGFGRYDSPHSEDQFSVELQTLTQMGIAFVSSGGNGGVGLGDGITYPAADPDGYSVGSVTTGDVISEFTQRSDNLDLLAVGENVRSPQRGGGFGTFNGTSFAAPAVAGAFALARQVDAGFALADVASMLRASGSTNRDGDAETGATTGLSFQRLDVAGLATLALQRRGGTAAQQAAVGLQGTRSDVQYDGFGVAHFVYYDDAARTMKYAVRNVGGQWSAATTIDASTPGAGTELSLKLTDVGRPRLAYLDGPNGDLKFAGLDDGRWAIETLDDKGVVGLYPSLVIDDAGTMSVAYLRKSTADLKLTVNDGTGWRRQTVDAAGDVGYAATASLDRNGRLTIGYGDETNDQLRFARRNDDGTFAFAVADSDVDGVAYVSLAFSTGNRARMSYYEIASADLKFAAQEGGGGWRARRLASKGATGLFTNLRIDDADAATITYWDRRTDSIAQAVGSGLNTGAFAVARIGDGGRYLQTPYSATDNAYVSVGRRGDRLAFGTL